VTVHGLHEKLNPVVHAIHADASGLADYNFGVRVTRHRFSPRLHETAPPPANSTRGRTFVGVTRYTRRFPYRVIYEVIEPENLVIVAAVLHAARHERHWKKRV
jgi:mRNA-degrading endonuclease RelE of RelBE toxin-antitoxin system